MLNSQAFRTRLNTALFLIAFTLLTIFVLPNFIFNTFLLVLVLLGASELRSLLKKIYHESNEYINFVFLDKKTTLITKYKEIAWHQLQQSPMYSLYWAILIITIVVGSLFLPLYVIGLGCVWWMIAPIILIQYSKKQYGLLLQKYMPVIIGVVIFAPLFVGLNFLQREFGPAYVLYILSLIWANDIGAYLAGSMFGKNLLAPNISPKKTIEGLLGGIVMAFLVILIGGLALKINNWFLWFILGIVLSLWSMIGDLFESMLKRLANVKDSSFILPGHGGIYDRIDSLTSAIPIFVFAIIMLKF